jgi:TolB-like protein/transcriptional regulator with XRE-family HTH domain/cytochrome c-type biogenesis protein CcmH/NrfG
VSQALGELSDSFSQRLSLALKALNFSRAQLASAVGVNKSLVSRWLSGQVTPSSHNLARISEVLARLRPGFNMTLWERPRDEFEAFLGLSAARGAMAPAPQADVPATARGSFAALISRLETSHLVTALGLVALVLLAVWSVSHRTPLTTAIDRTSLEPPGAAGLPPANSIAVLPFINLSGDRSDEYFCDGVSQEILDTLARSPDLEVISRSSSFSFKGQSDDLRAIGRKLGVRQLVEGSVRREGKRVRIAVELVRAQDGVELWSQSFDRDLSDILRVQEEIADAIAARLAARSANANVARDAPAANAETDPNGARDIPTANAVAYDDYLRAFAEDSGAGTTFERGQRAIGDLEQAVKLDPRFAAAWAELAWYYGYREQERPGAVGDSPASMAQQELAARRALSLDPHSSVAFIVLAHLATERADFAAAEADYQRALALNPNSFHASDEYGGFLSRVGHVAGAIEVLRKAHSLAPRSGGATSDYGYLLFLADPRSSVGRELLDVALPLDPRHYRARYHELIAHLADGKLGAAIADQRVLDSLSTNDAARRYGEGLVLAAHDPAALRSYLRRGASRASDLYAYGIDLTPWALAAGDVELATETFVEVETARIKAGDTHTFYRLLPPQFEPLRRDPRVKALLVKAGLPRYWRARGWPDACHPRGPDDFVCD